MKLTLLILFMSLSAGASDLHDMLNAKSVNELEARTRTSNDLQRTRESCASELRAHLIPRACFKELALTNQPSSAKLTRICAENAKSSRSRLDLGGVMDQIPDDCRKVAADRLEDLRYIDERKSPDLGPEFEKTESD